VESTGSVDTVVVVSMAAVLSLAEEELTDHPVEDKAHSSDNQVSRQREAGQRPGARTCSLCVLYARCLCQKVVVDVQPPDRNAQA